MPYVLNLKSTILTLDFRWLVRDHHQHDCLRWIRKVGEPQISDRINRPGTASMSSVLVMRIPQN
jgi:hypothetical protein